MTNAEKIARHGGQAVIDFFIKGYTECPYTRSDKAVCMKPISCRVCWCDWLTQEATDKTENEYSTNEIFKFLARPISDLDLRQMDKVTEAVYNAIKHLNEAFVEVVKCKDCQYFYALSSDKPCCTLHSGLVDTYAEGYCHHGLRRNQ